MKVRQKVADASGREGPKLGVQINGKGYRYIGEGTVTKQLFLKKRQVAETHGVQRLA